MAATVLVAAGLAAGDLARAEAVAVLAALVEADEATQLIVAHAETVGVAAVLLGCQCRQYDL